MNFINTKSTDTTGKGCTRHTIIPVAGFVKISKEGRKGLHDGIDLHLSVTDLAVGSNCYSR